MKKDKKIPTFTRIQKSMISHNKSIIEENICFGLCHPGDYTSKEIKEYRKEAYQEQKEFKEFLKNGGFPVFNPETEMWEVPYYEA